MGEETVTPEVVSKKKIAIIGFSEHKKEAPFQDKSFEIWGLNDLHEAIPRWDRWFEMHGDNQIKDYCSRKQGKPYLEGLASLNCPVYMLKVRPEVPNSVKYPLEEMVSKFGRYFTNSISFMLAMAIDEIEKGLYEPVVHVYGVDMAQDSEYNHQRPSCEYFLGIAVGRGIQTFVPKTSDLLKARWLYGYEEHEMDAYNARVSEIYKGVLARRQAAEQQMEQVKASIWQYRGAEDAINTLQRIHV